MAAIALGAGVRQGAHFFMQQEIREEYGRFI